MQNLLKAKYGKKAINNFINLHFKDNGVCFYKDISPLDDHAYIMSLLIAMECNDVKGQYKIERLEGVYKETSYTLPQLRFVRKGGK